MRCPTHHAHTASITTKLRRLLRKRQRFSKFSPTFFGKPPTFFFFSPTFFEIARTFLSPTALTLLPFSLILIFSPLFSRWGEPSSCAHIRSHTAILLFLLSQPSQILSQQSISQHITRILGTLFTFPCGERE